MSGKLAVETLVARSKERGSDPPMSLEVAQSIVEGIETLEASKVIPPRPALTCQNMVATTLEWEVGGSHPCGQVAQNRDIEGRALCVDCADEVEASTGNNPSHLYYCAWCMRGCIAHQDGSAGCPSCEWIWSDPLSKTEAEAFKTAWDSFGPDRVKAGIDWSERAAAAWEAVGNLRS